MTDIPPSPLPGAPRSEPGFEDVTRHEQHDHGPLPPSGSLSDDLHIGLWGAASSGKTTFVNALAHTDGTLGYGDWRVSGLDDAAKNFLIEGKRRLINEGRFPEATQAENELRFSFDGQRPEGGRTGFVLRVQDRPGGVFKDGNVYLEKVARQLTMCDGLVLLFDPIREERDCDSADHLFDLLHHIATLLAEEGRSSAFLPFEVAVCVTKWDHPEVFLPARAAGWGTQDDPDSVPRVKERDAKDYFTWACHHFGRHAGQHVDQLLGKHFDPDRTCYFVSSSIGFKRFDGRRFDARQYANLQDNRVEQMHPINVIEPFLELERRLRKPP
ncbi:hypothetical protein FXF51_27090 [Nonomuraea sp. PA05]|uniref:hypothetical protein n=1 Tax=Nonomuraea sp. PA05 TaxID=2604466 RepID=UPI0011D43E6A|nr:hypothetical protein [Nonomuraea sp. PA05]TYB61748.1 hypothetical protein FXF51_27090 [Nonomuraea sp. PA05]